MAERWSDCPVVFIPAVPRKPCPLCGSVEQPIIVRSEQQDDGATVRKCICRSCSERFRIIVEPEPWSDNDDPPAAESCDLELDGDAMARLREIRKRRGLPITGNRE